MSDIEISILDHCTGGQLKELLALASTDERTARYWLVEVGDLEQLEYLLTEMCAGTEQSGQALLRSVCSPDTPADVLIGIKSTAKHLAFAANGPRQDAAATLLYHLTVAAALGHHGRNISSKDPAERLGLYQDLAEGLPDDELAAVFGRAVGRFSAGPPGEVGL